MSDSITSTSPQLVFNSNQVQSIHNALLAHDTGSWDAPVLPDVPTISKTAFNILIDTINSHEVGLEARTEACRLLSAWLSKAVAQKKNPSPATSPETNFNLANVISQASTGKFSVWDRIFDIFLTFFEDSPSSLTKALRELLLALVVSYPHVRRDEDLPYTGFYQQLASTLLEKFFEKRHNGGSKVSFFTLEVLVRAHEGRGHVSAQFMIETYGRFKSGGEKPDLIKDLLFQMRDRMLAPSASKLLVALLERRRTELGHTKKEEFVDPNWTQLWREPLKHALREEHARLHILLYMLPAFLKICGAAAYTDFMEGWGLERVGDHHELTVLTDLVPILVCLRAGKQAGYVQDGVHIKSPREASKNHIILKAEALGPLIGHRDDSVALSAMTLLVASTAITAPMSPDAFELLKKSFLHLHGHQNAEFRNQFVVIIRDFAQRLAGSSVYLTKELEKLDKAIKATSVEYKDKRSALQELASETNDRLIATEQFVVWYVKFLFSLLETGRGHAQVTTALRILKMLMQTGLDKEFFDPSTKLDVKTNKTVNVLKGNPIVWPFQVTIGTESNLRWVLETLFNRYEDARLLAGEILCNASKSPWKTPEQTEEYVINAFNRMIKSGRARDADGFAQLALVLSYLAARNDETLPASIFGVTIFNTGNAVAVIDWLYNLLEEQFLAQAKVKLTEAVAKKPMHGVISAIRTCITNGPTSEGDAASEWRPVCKSLLNSCGTIWEIVSPVLCDVAPEGFTLDEEEDGNSPDTQSIMSYSWRAIKESSALISAVLTKKIDDQVLLDREEFIKGGSILLSGLADIRHRGAFSAISPSYIAVCETCFQSYDTDIQVLPEVWLMDNISLVVKKSANITRRSAGIPMLVTGTLAVEVDPGRPLLEKTYNKLREIASEPVDGHENIDQALLPQVHALNCIKALFTDSRTSARSKKFLGDGLDLAIQCFRSPVWPIRNCGIMLYTALINRLFGTTKSRNVFAATSGLHTTKSFFSKYPGIRNTLQENLEKEIQSYNETGRLNAEMLFPALALLSRLDCSPEFAEMAPFEPLIRDCMKNKNMRIRFAAAKALTAMIETDYILPEIADSLSCNIDHQNYLHGRLLGVQALIRRSFPRLVEFIGAKEAAEKVAELLFDGFTPLVRLNPCPITAGEMLQTCYEFAHQHDLKNFWGSSVSDDQWDIVREATGKLRTLMKEVADYQLETYFKDGVKSPPAVGSDFYFNILAQVIIKSGLFLQASAYLQKHAGGKKQDVLAFKLLEYLAESSLDFEKEEKERLAAFLWSECVSSSCQKTQLGAANVLVKLTQDGNINFSKNPLADLGVINELYSNSPVEPLREALLILTGTLLAQVLEDKDIEVTSKALELNQAAYLLEWTVLDSESWDTRYSVLEALRRLEPLLRANLDLKGKSAIEAITEDGSEEPETLTPEHYLPLYRLLNDFLHDDDEDIRFLASDVAQSILAIPIPQIPLEASSALLSRVARIPSPQGALQALVLERLTSLSPMDISNLIYETKQNATVLFVKEKQNLFIQQADTFASLLRLSTESVTKPTDEQRSQLRTYIQSALEPLLREIRVNRKSALLADVANDEDLWLLGVRLCRCIELSSVWDSQAGDLDGLAEVTKEWEAMRKAVADMGSAVWTALVDGTEVAGQGGWKKAVRELELR
ncbi:hypothetical protein BJ508DRAFT_378707 [Ascobolus immersus RN42]|uniref:Uncharacterized protein n=1 Tax=Ascobolus immersus RN42 TaxID=1160509 RepID=A0A3N4HV98_ASCIM|nr:hypothetical protein BJ508DRAFT_378707 [Ascobolus immersus RN42]